MSTSNVKTIDITFTPVTVDKLSHVIMLAHRIWPIAYEGILTPEQIENMLQRIYIRENLEKEIQSGHQFWLAYHDTKPVGYASAYKEDDIIWLRKLYVDVSMQGKRIGSRLMHTTITPFLPAQEIRLFANPYNTSAHTFYERMGFKKIGETPVQMGDWNFNDFIFSLPLNEK